MKKLFTTYEIALKLKEIGFNEPCLKYFKDGEIWNLYKIKSQGCESADFEETTNNEIDLEYEDYSFPEDGDELGVKYLEPCSAPLWQQAIDFLETKGYMVSAKRAILYDINKVEFIGYICWIIDLKNKDPFGELPCLNELIKIKYKTKNEALNIVILKAIEIIKEKNL